MINAERIVRELDSRLDHAVNLVLYGRAKPLVLEMAFD